TRDFEVNGLPSKQLIFAGEVNNELYFYTKAFEGDQAYSHQMLLSYWLDFLYRPYFHDELSDDTIIIKSFDLQQVALLSETDVKCIKQYASKIYYGELFVRSNVVYYVRLSSDKQETKITRVSRNLVVIEPGPLGSGKIPTSLYAQEDCAIYLLFGKELLLIGLNLSFIKIEIDQPNCEIVGANAEKLFFSSGSLHLSFDLGEEHRRLAFALAYNLKDEAPKAVNDMEIGPDEVTRYTLTNGSHIFFRNYQFNELYSGSCKSKDYLVDGLTSEQLIFAGELKNKLYFYTKANEEDKHNYLPNTISHCSLLI
ncbi:hypothetical protein PENTCL1PPCAC_8777, partial [Pristionchus entomophagus]